MRSHFCWRRRKPLRALCLLFSALSAFPLIAQTPQPTFDVASIRPTPTTHDGRSHIWSDPANSHFKTENESVDGLLQYAFDLPDTRILGGPAALRHTSFDIDASADATTDAALKALPPEAATVRKRAMLQALLRDRFHLSTHTETRDLPVYALVIAKSGPKLTPTDDHSLYNLGSDHLTGIGFTSAILAQDLARYAGRIVVDRTGLTGRYKIDLHWSRDSDPNPSLPNFFTAVEEQLGLRLEPTHAPVEVLVIDRLEAPTGN